MLNREKYAKEIIDIACEGGNIAIVDGKPENCRKIKCKGCVFDGGTMKYCERKTREWANSEYVEPVEPSVDWSKVPVDTPILVRDSELFAWSKEHFAKYEDETVYTWDYGKTSWSTYDGKMSSYKYAMLPESEDQNENKQD